MSHVLVFVSLVYNYVVVYVVSWFVNRVTYFFTMTLSSSLPFIFDLYSIEVVLLIGNEFFSCKEWFTRVWRVMLIHVLWEWCSFMYRGLVGSLIICDRIMRLQKNTFRLQMIFCNLICNWTLRSQMSFATEKFVVANSRMSFSGYNYILNTWAWC